MASAADPSSSGAAKIIDGTAVAKYGFRFFLFASRPDLTRRVLAPRSIREGVTSRIAALKGQYPRFQPKLTIVQAGARPDSNAYVRMKAKAAEEVGVAYQHIAVPAEASVEEVVKIVKNLNDDETVSGILVQLPLGEHVKPEGERTVTEAVSPQKDVDG